MRQTCGKDHFRQSEYNLLKGTEQKKQKKSRNYMQFYMTEAPSSCPGEETGNGAGKTG